VDWAFSGHVSTYPGLAALPQVRALLNGLSICQSVPNLVPGGLAAPDAIGEWLR
jgi:hypothetical protein